MINCCLMNSLHLKSIQNKIVDAIGANGMEFLLHTKNYFTATLLLKGIYFLTIPIFTSLLTPADYGILGIYTSLVSIFTVLIGLNFDSATIRYFYEDQDDYEDFIRSVYWFVTVIGVFCIVLIYIFRNAIAIYFNVEEDIVLYAVLVPFFNHSFMMYLSTMQAKRQSKRYSQLVLLQRLSSLALTILVIYLMTNDRYLGRIYMELLTAGISFLLFLRYFGKKYTFHWRYIKYAANIAIPLIPHVLSSFIMSYFARIIINKVDGSASAGIFSLADDVGAIMMVVSMSFNKSWTPIFYQKMNDNDVIGIRKQSARIIKYTALIAVFLIFFSREIVLLVANDRYLAALAIVPPIILGKAFGPLYTIYSHVTDYYKKMIAISITTIAVGIFNIFLNSIFIPEYGVIAGAYTSMTCSILLFVFHYVTARYIIGSKVLLLRPMLTPYIWVVLAIVFYLWGVENIESLLLFILIKVTFLVLIFIAFFKARIV